MRGSFTTAFLTVVLASSSAPRLWADYDPLAAEKVTPKQKDLVVTDEKRSREIPIRVYFPKDESPAAVVLFSHGLGGHTK